MFVVNVGQLRYKDLLQIFLTAQKELHFFSYQELTKYDSGPGDKLAQVNIIKDYNEYLELYKNVKTEKAIGDISPSYFYFSKYTIPLIKKYLGHDVKIIISLRDPIERAFSNFLHQKRLLYEKLDFHEALYEELNRKNKGFSDFWEYSVLDKSIGVKRLLGVVDFSS